MGKEHLTVYQALAHTSPSQLTTLRLGGELWSQAACSNPGLCDLQQIIFFPVPQLLRL